MPLRSPKMYSFIFGFQRFVWWPKWTPASNNSCIEIPVKLPPHACDGSSSRLALTELEAFPRSRQSVLLALLGARIARQEAMRLEGLAQLGVRRAERPGNAEAQRAGLAGDAAT